MNKNWRLLVLLACSFLYAFASADTTSATNPLCKSASDTTKLNEKSYVLIGGIKQWITIKGDSCANPVVLFVHGGPGNPTSLFSEDLYKEWEHEFTIVQWDQRGAGKTFEANQKSSEITPEDLANTELSLALIATDGIEVADYLHTTLKKNKIIITAASWGSAVGIKMISKRPDLFYFYVGVSQLVNYETNLLTSYQLALNIAQQNHDQNALEFLQSAGAPPWKNPRNFGKLRKITRAYEAKVNDQTLSMKTSAEYQTEAAQLAYGFGEDFSFMKFLGMDGDGMAQTIALDKTDLDFKIPVHLIQGKEDLLTSPDVTEKYLSAIKSPGKSYVLVEKSGHDLSARIFNAQITILRAGVKHIAKH
ncbi:MAG: alpha/beta hydrolase [Gammaproteobacteria bacterium]|nr:MAG: alpha/beta hydrolase [Gammaproteobacteria bacterium]